MHAAYFETQFRIPNSVREWPKEFVILTAYQSTGQKWPDERNLAADRELEVCLRERGVWLQRVTGYSPTTQHAEPGWAFVMEFNEACDLGIRFSQDAIYLVAADLLFVSYCDTRRKSEFVGKFGERVTVSND